MHLKTLEKKSPEWRFKTVQLNDPWAQRKLKIFLPQAKDSETKRLEELKEAYKYFAEHFGRKGGL